MARYVRAADGRVLAYETWGDPKGWPIFLLHGTPGCRLGPRPRSHELALMGIRLIAYDRPGYGLSDRQPGRRVADAAADVERIADSLALDRFAVVGRSGGGPHALACAALLAHRVTSAAALVSLAPPDAAGLDWLAGMVEGNARRYALARRVHGDPSLVDQLAADLARSPRSLISLDFLDAEMADGDRRVLEDPGIRGLLVENFRHAVGDARNSVPLPDVADRGPYDARSLLLGHLDDVLACSGEWGVPLDAITAPVLLWHGEDDVFSPVSHSLWLAGRIPDARPAIERGEAHFRSLEVLPSVLQWLRRHSRRRVAPALSPSVMAGAVRGRS